MLPDLPTIADTVPGYESSSWLGLLAPAATPRPIIDKLNAALNSALATDEVRQRLAIEGAEPQPTTPEEYGAIIDREVTMWSDLVKAAGIKPE
jgi:tripartite-type tricarboxylate transporter receptor subunit TctC